MSALLTKPFTGPGGDVDFLLEVVALEEALVTFRLLQVNSWSGSSPEGTSLYADGFIKFDGCSSVNFPPWLHLCGASWWKLHCAVMEWTYRELFPLIKDADPSEAWTPDNPNKE